MTGSSPLARSALLRRASFSVYLLLYPLPWLVRGTTLPAILAFLAGFTLFLVLPFLPGRYALTIGLRAWVYALIGIALMPFGGYWGVFFISAAATCGAMPRTTTRLISFAALLAVCAGTSWFFTQDMIGTLITLIVATGVHMTGKLSMDLHRQNEALAKAQSDIRALTLIAERERFARDLHDTLGHSLTLIALKSELALRHLPHAPEDATKELVDIGEKARQALSETRLTVSAIRIASLETELEGGRKALEEAGIQVNVLGQASLMPASAEGVLAQILREALTNILRHARAQTCSIRFALNGPGQAMLEIIDRRADRLDGEIPLSFREGNGISGMRARLAEVDGSLTITPRHDGTTLLITLGPLHETEAAPRSG